jgi:F-type H+-transporting ATPase subunit b
MEILNQFGIQPILLAAQVVNFAILFFILKKLLFKPIITMLKARQATIAKSLEDAAEIETRLQKTEEDREKVLQKAALEAKKMIDETTQQASQIIAEAHTKASADMENILEQGRQSIRLEKEKMQQEIRAELADLLVLGLEKVAGKVLTQKDQKELVRETVHQL